MADPVRTRLTEKEGRRFSLTLALAFGALGGLAWWRAHGTVAYALWALAALLGLAGLLIPGRLGPVQRAWMGLAHAISKVTTPAFMGIVYFLVITPIGWIMRGLGRDPLDHGDPGDSYWVARTSGPESGDMRRQF